MTNLELKLRTGHYDKSLVVLLNVVVFGSYALAYIWIFSP